MTGDEFKEAITKLGFANYIAFGNCIGTHPRTVQKWYLGELIVPRHIAMLVNLMLDTKTTAEGLRP